MASTNVNKAVQRTLENGALLESLITQDLHAPDIPAAIIARFGSLAPPIILSTNEATDFYAHLVYAKKELTAFGLLNAYRRLQGQPPVPIPIGWGGPGPDWPA
jgi:hypothetical protein